MPTWTDDNGDVAASTTFTDAKGRHYIAGVQVPDVVWDEHRYLADRVATLESMSRSHLAGCRAAKDDYRATIRTLAELVRGAQEAVACEPGADWDGWWAAAEAALAGLDPHTCTGLTATWCPRCGDCACPADEDDLDDPTCSLHGRTSQHGHGTEGGVDG